jgi:putative ABC transport system substrate-binding protein
LTLAASGERPSQDFPQQVRYCLIVHAAAIHNRWGPLAIELGRREFISAFGSVLGAASVWPFAARAQPADKMRRVGVLPAGYLQTDPEGQARIAALLDTLGKRGWNGGRNVQVDVHWSSNAIERIREEATAVVASAPDAIVVSSNAGLSAVLKLNKTIPTVFVQVSDPGGSGFVSSLARPDGNITGFQNFEPAMGGKWLGLLKEAAPAVTRVAVILHPDTAVHFEFLREAEAVAASLQIQLSAIKVSNDEESERGIAGFAETPGGGLIILPHPGNINNRALLIASAARLGLPAIYPFRYFAADGGLMSYGFDQIEQWRGAAGYIDRILRGARPADLPVQAPTKYDLVLNLRAARALGLAISPPLLATASEVIE